MNWIPIVVFFALRLPQNAPFSYDRATPEEVVDKVHQATQLLREQGEAGLTILRDSTSDFNWKDTYVFVVNCQADVVLANPVFPEREGGDIKQHSDYNGKRYGVELCEKANPQGIWIEYVWPKPGSNKSARKISYVVALEELPYQVGAGIYNDSISLEALNKLVVNYH